MFLDQSYHHVLSPRMFQGAVPCRGAAAALVSGSAGILVGITLAGITRAGRHLAAGGDLTAWPGSLSLTAAFGRP
ncbi:MAG: hypothetical protein LBR80_10895 [Deltaproteobacteria bacterium]|nr:hypothetical protein [Deltaproteobacteria bacterium]